MITAVSFTIVGVLFLMICAIILLHSKVVAETNNHVSLSPWHVVCLAMALIEYSIVGAASTAIAGPLLFIVFIMASAFSVAAFLIVINNLIGRLRGAKAESK